LADDAVSSSFTLSVSINAPTFDNIGIFNWIVHPEGFTIFVIATPDIEIVQIHYSRHNYQSCTLESMAAELSDRCFGNA
jgi:hypothetical protein